MKADQLPPEENQELFVSVLAYWFFALLGYSRSLLAYASRCLQGAAVPLLVCYAVAPASLLAAQSNAHTSAPLAFTASNTVLQEAFTWAKDQAQAYVFTSAPPVENFYEAALPGRNAFCMRDVSHQALGAEALGLSVQNKTMLRLFASSMAESRDWTPFWEIDRQGGASSADYVSDNDFWYNLPAAFDVMHAALRLYMWTGDEDYIASPIFRNFYRHVATDYLDRWQLHPDQVITRKRILNQRLDTGKFVTSRGIPSYTEGRADFNLGTDLLAAEYRALISYNELLHMQNEATPPTQQATRVAHLLATHGWNSQRHHYYGFLRKDGSNFGSGDQFVLYFNAATSVAQRQGARTKLIRLTKDTQTGIEEQSYRPEILFRYGAPDEAYEQILDLSRPNRKRREYPEVSYAVVGAIVSGMMGVEVRPLETGQGSLSRNVVIETLPRLPKCVHWARLQSLSVRGNLIDLRHDEDNSSTLTNVSGASITWRAAFPGITGQLWVNGQRIPARQGTTAEELPISYVDLNMAPKQTITVETVPRRASQQKQLVTGGLPHRRTK